jgi:hypothetical protein
MRCVTSFIIPSTSSTNNLFQRQHAALYPNDNGFSKQEHSRTPLLHLAIFVILRVSARRSLLSHPSSIVFFVNKQEIQKYLNLHFFRAKVKTRLAILIFNYTSKQNISSKAFGFSYSILFLQSLNMTPTKTTYTLKCVPKYVPALSPSVIHIILTFIQLVQITHFLSLSTLTWALPSPNANVDPSLITPREPDANTKTSPISTRNAQGDPFNNGMGPNNSPFSVSCSIPWDESECYGEYSETCELWGYLPWEMSCQEEGCSCVEN